MMKHSATVMTFGPFRVVANKRELWKREKLLKLRALPVAVLAYLVQHPGRVIPIEEIRTAIWGDTRVGRGAIRVCVREIRQALEDEAASPQYIETVGRQGYRFLGALATTPPATRSQVQFLVCRAPFLKRRPLARVAPLTLFVGRDRELAQLQQWVTQAQQGQRQVVLVSGEPGIGKTTVVEFQQFSAVGVEAQAAALEPRTQHQPLTLRCGSDTGNVSRRMGPERRTYPS